MKFEKSSEEGENERAYKKRHVREIDDLLRKNGAISSGTPGTSAYLRGHIWNFEWCSEDPEKARPDLVRLVQAEMAAGNSFENAFDQASEHL